MCSRGVVAGVCGGELSRGSPMCSHRVVGGWGLPSGPCTLMTGSSTLAVVSAYLDFLKPWQPDSKITRWEFLEHSPLQLSHDPPPHSRVEVSQAPTLTQGQDTSTDSVSWCGSGRVLAHPMGWEKCILENTACHSQQFRCSELVFRTFY